MSSTKKINGETVINWGTITLASNEDIQRFMFVKSKMEGLIVGDGANDNISYARSGLFKPVNGKKMTLCGKLDAFFIHNEPGDEYDWNLNIIPNEEYKYIVEEVRGLVEDRSEWKKC